MRKYILLFLLMYPVLLFAQDYNVGSIPDSIKNNSDVVVRYDEVKVIIKGIDKCVIKRKYAITILNEAGDSYGTYFGVYNKLNSLNSAEGKLFDAAGKPLRSVKKKDMTDKASDGDELASDLRYKVHNFFYRQYPYTIEYEDEAESEGTLFLPSWYPVKGSKYAVEQSRFIVETPPAYELRYKVFNVDKPLATSQTDKVKTYTWEIKNVRPIESEPYQPKHTKPLVYLGAVDFQMQQYKGNMSSWQNLGKFFMQLYDGRDELPDNVKQDVHRIADNLPDKKAKTKALYEYMQKNTRYVSIQLGIGGWQPFDAKFVATKKYGDCKALSNYMKALLKEAGIKANCVVIRSDEDYVGNGLFEDFPTASGFNHVVACVPDGKDTLWLECTNQTTSAGYMSSSTYGRKAFMLDDDGGHIVSTPNYTSTENSQLRKINASINAEGNLSAKVFTKFSGIQQDLQHSLINGVSKEERDKYLNSTLRLPTYKVNRSDYSEIKKEIPEVDEILEIDAPNYASVSGKRIFVEPNLFNKTAIRLTDDKPRKYGIEIQDAFLDVDTAVISVPAGYKIEAAPKDVAIDNKFGKYSISFKFNDNSITVIRVHEEKQAMFPASDYPEFMKYHNDMYKADRSKMVLVKNE